MRELDFFESQSIGGGNFWGSLWAAIVDTAGLAWNGCSQGTQYGATLGGMVGFVGTSWTGPGSIAGAGSGAVVGGVMGCPVGAAAALGGGMVGTATGGGGG